MSNKLKIIILVVLATIVIGILIFSMISSGAIITSTLLKALIVLAGLAASIIKISARINPSKALYQYENIYSDILDDAFNNNKTSRKRLLEVAKCYAEDDLQNGLAKVNELWNSCKTISEMKAVGTFKALILSDLGNEMGAKEIYEHLINDLEIKNDTIYSNLGLIYSNSGDLENAIKYYTLANETNPNNAYAWNNAAFVLIRLFEIDKAIECAENAIKIDFKMHQPYEILAAAYTYKGNKALAKKYYHTAIVNGANKVALKDFMARFEPDTDFEDEDNE
ncbi:MAG: tetratricopeptide repeat protein [Clostridia bacterium]|nr:tetratricopeptide repeat protein [Clostridia bacterium]MBO5020645.1 tetratricopeptide repeat protein [Clostridia bacterium]